MSAVNPRPDSNSPNSSNSGLLNTAIGNPRPEILCPRRQQPVVMALAPRLPPAPPITSAYKGVTLALTGVISLTRRRGALQDSAGRIWTCRHATGPLTLTLL